MINMDQLMKVTVIILRAVDHRVIIIILNMDVEGNCVTQFMKLIIQKITTIHFKNKCDALLIKVILRVIVIQRQIVRQINLVVYLTKLKNIKFWSFILVYVYLVSF